MLHFLNHLRETKHYGNGRLIRSSFSQRVGDAFLTFFRLLDYPTLGIGPLYTYCSDKPKLKYLLPILFIPLLAVGLVKGILASALTLAVSPIVAIVHLALRSTKSKLFEQAKKLKVIPYKGNDKIPEEGNDLARQYTTQHIQRLLIKPMYKKNEFSVDLWSKCESEKFSSWMDPKYGLSLALYENTILWGRGLIAQTWEEPMNAMVKNTPENVEPLKAILKMNMFRTTSELEKVNALERIEREYRLS